MDEHRTALDVAQKAVAEAVAFVGAFDEAGDVGDDKGLVIVGADHAEVGDERGEGIVGDLRLRGADDGDQRRLAGIRKSDQADVGDQLQLDEELALVAGVAILRKARRLTRGGGEVLVAPAAAPALGDEDALALVREVGDDFLRCFVANDRSDRQLDGDVIAVVSGAVRAHAVLAAAGFPLALKLQVVERVQAPRGDDPDRSARAAVAAGRAAFRDELLAPKSDAAFPAVSGFDANGGLVDEHCS